ncbi:MAG: diheme cytochrome c-553 [Lutibacter sp.]|uniref:diheme cytochrome c-553 n=1 Tax=Lutibacter sp. TaxID=1925666 RepID=UPI00299DB465|nr:diheme cytochrome c-553 [Lutibacter sp.]MDX1828119.1 diheme cytochrome c-553 [Lutibacter sp.]
MKKLIFYSCCIVTIVFLSKCKKAKALDMNKKEAYKPIDTLQEMITRGAYLVNTIGCDDCHSPKKMTPKGPVPDLERRFSGYSGDEPLPKINKNDIEPGKWMLMNGDLTAFVGPWGVSFASNLTPDPTGLGNWTFKNFKTALSEGKFKGIENQRMLLPPMPWQNFRKLTDSDLRAMFEYFKTVKPINNIVPSPIPLTNINDK